MPRRRSQSEQRVVYLAVAAVAVGLLALLGISYLAGQDKVELSNLADREFEAGSTGRYAERIAEDGRPFIIPDASNGDRPIFVDHDGGPPDRGWIAILAVEDGCALEYVGRGYVDCEGRTFPREGTGLRQYRTRVEDGVLYVDLRDEVGAGAGEE